MLILIVSDSKESYKFISGLAMQYPGITETQHARNLEECREMMARLMPAIIVYMQGSSTSLTEDYSSLLDKQKFRFIFVVAHEESVKILKAVGITSLLKPVIYENLHRAIKKTIDAIVAASNRTAQEMRVLCQHDPLLPNAEMNLNRVFGNSKWNAPVMLHNISWIEVDGPYLNVHLVNKSYKRFRESLKKVMNELPKDMFFQNHRDTVVNINEIKQYLSHCGTVQLMSETVLPTAKLRKKDLHARCISRQPHCPIKKGN